MILHYLRTSIRYLTRRAGFTFINITGLAIGLASCIVIFFYIMGEWSYDNFWKDKNRIYRIQSSWNSDEGKSKLATAPPALIPLLLNEDPEVEAGTRLFKWNDFTLRPDTDSSNVFRETNVYMADENYFKVFKNRLIKGNPETALKNPVTIVLSESAAIRYFGEDFYEHNEVLGRNILGGKDGGTLWHITGIMKDIPANSHQNFDILISSSTFGDEFDNSQVWNWNIFYSYILLDEKANNKKGLALLSQKLDDVVRDHVDPFLKEYQEDVAVSGLPVTYSLMPLTDIHLKSNFLREMRPNGDMRYVITLSAICILILIIACVNFMNLSTALSSQRAKEVGVRKSLGSHTGSLVTQFLSESILLVMVSIVISLGLVELFMIELNKIFNFNFFIGPYDSPYFIPALIILGIVVGLFAGIYPSVFLSSFNPVKVLKSHSTISFKKGNLASALVIFQFIISMGLIISTIIIMNQINYIQTKKLGFNKENVVIIQNDREIDDRRQEFKDVLDQHPEIINSSFSTGVPALNEFRIRDYTVEGRQEGTGFRWYEIDEDYLPTMKLELSEGRNFSRFLSGDSSGLILNEAAVKELNIKDPVGKRIIINLGATDERKVTIVGVVKDFNYESFKREIMPLGMEFLNNYVFKDYISIRIVPGKEREAVDIIKKTWHEFEPQVPITYSFLDQNFDAMFKSEMAINKIFKLFTGLAIFISCMGLFGLAAFSTEQKRKEIGVRKVMGASTLSLIILFSKRFVTLALAGFIIAAPISYWFMNNWLSNFAYHSGISAAVFILGAMISILLAAVTVSYQSLKLSLMNPTETLKEE